MYAVEHVRMGEGLARCGQKRTSGEGVKNYQIFADLLYGRPLTHQ